jgi:hypothetical protein
LTSIASKTSQTAAPGSDRPNAWSSQFPLHGSQKWGIQGIQGHSRIKAAWLNAKVNSGRKKFQLCRRNGQYQRLDGGKAKINIIK